MQGLWSLLTNPNVIYILLIVGLWAATAALYVPGTGLLEVTAAICLALAICSNRSSRRSRRKSEPSSDKQGPASRRGWPCCIRRSHDHPKRPVT